MSNPKQINKPPKPIKTTIIKPLCFNPWVLLSHTMRPSRCSLSLIPSCSLTHSFPSSSTPPSRQLPHAYTLHLSLFPFKRGLQQGRQILLHACRLGGSCNIFKSLGLEITSIISADAPFERRSGIHRKSEMVIVHDHVCIYLTSIIEKNIILYANPWMNYSITIDVSLNWTQAILQENWIIKHLFIRILLRKGH